jgi:hypothetical protein
MHRTLHSLARKFWWRDSWLGTSRIIISFHQQRGYKGKGSSIDGWGTILQAGRSRVQVPIWSLFFSIYLILPAALWVLGLTQLLTKMSTRNTKKMFLESRAGSYGWQFLRHLWADCLDNVGSSTSLNSTGLHGQLRGQLCFLLEWKRVERINLRHEALQVIS